jgi:hypothetical protein
MGAINGWRYLLPEFLFCSWGYLVFSGLFGRALMKDTVTKEDVKKTKERSLAGPFFHYLWQPTGYVPADPPPPAPSCGIKTDISWEPSQGSLQVSGHFVLSPYIVCSN